MRMEYKGSIITHAWTPGKTGAHATIEYTVIKTKAVRVTRLKGY